ncbi:MAG: DEAD/DEAH box helicase [Synergistaceae bacterium]|nr:DEAD/DEAH box helicase [Synergistaceae bacterium]MBQ3759122.1 DEAD/DEAH box helicase [Synergistaceae bacterium]
MELHGYQKYAVKFIAEHPQSAVLLDCGCGKTVIALTAIRELGAKKVLVICPIRVAQVWADEIQKWEHLRGLKYSIAVGNAEERRAALEREADIHIINRDVISWLVSNVKWKWDMVVIDELSSFKNSQTKRFKSLMRVRPYVKRIVGLTGTPSSNGLMDLWSEYRLIDFGQRLGRFIGQYRQKYFQPDKTNGVIVYSYKPLPGAEKRIYEKIKDITISMRSTELLRMPELISVPYEVKLSAGEREAYNTLKRELVLGDDITASNAAALSVKLSQMANGAVYDDSGKVKEIHKRKVDALEDIIEAQCGKPLLVAYWFKHDLERITERLNGLGIAWERINSTEAITRWNAGEIPVGLIHPASAGHGINLQAGGNTLVWFGLTWSLELYIQTNARLWRQGQKSGTVVVMHIITKGTIDEEMLKALARKEVTQDGLMEAVKKCMRT